MPYNPIQLPSESTSGYKSIGAAPVSTGYHPIGSAPVAPVASPVPPTVSTPSPYFSAVDKTGNSFGFADEKDVSGKPFFAYRAPGDTSTTTDKTRVATSFDPRTPTPIKQKDLTNGRMPESVSSSIKKALGGVYSDELDHAISLELSGSNDKSNLIIQKGRQGGAAAESDKLENILAKKVVTGQMSLFDAQKEIAKNKGVKTPFTGAYDFKFDNPFPSDINGKMQTSTPATTATPIAPSVDLAKPSGQVLESHNSQNKKGPEMSIPDIISGQGTYETVKLAHEHPDKVDPMMYLARGIGFGHDPINEATNWAAGFAKTPTLSDLPEPTTKGQKAAQMFGQTLTIALSAPAIDAVAAKAISTIPGGAELLAKASEASKLAPWSVGYPLAVGKAFANGSLFGLLTKNKQSIAQNVIQTGGSFAAFEALAFPVMAFFKPVFESVGKASFESNGALKLPEDFNANKIATTPVSDTLWFKNPEDPTQLLKVTREGIQSVPEGGKTEVGTENAPILTKVDVEAFKQNPSLYERLSNWIRGKYDEFQAIPNKQGGFVKNPLAEEVSGEGKPKEEQSAELPFPTDKGQLKDIKDTTGEAPVGEGRGGEDGEAPVANTSEENVALDKRGVPITTPFGDKLPLNPDGTITVYHRTTPEIAEKIKQEGLAGSTFQGDEGKVFVSTNPEGGRNIGKEKTAVLKFNVDPTKFNVDEAFRDGSIDLVAQAKDLEGVKPTRVPKETPANLEKANRQVTARYQNEEIEASKKNPELDKLNIEIELLREQVQTHKGRAFRPYAQNGVLPEVTGKPTMRSKTGNGAVVPNSLFGQHGDKIIQEILGMGDTYEKSPSVEDAQRALDQYRSMRKRLEALKAERRKLVQAGREFRNKEKSKTSITRMLDRQTPVSEEPNEDYLNYIKDKKATIAKKMAVDQVDAVTAFFEQNPDVLDDYEESGKLDEKMGEFITEYLGNISAEAEGEVNEEVAKAMEQDKTEARQAKLDAIVEEYHQKGITIDRQILEKNGGIVPPTARGGLRSPQFDVSALKDMSTLLMARDTFERNIEKVAPPDVAEKINQFYTEKIRDNEKAAVEFKNEVRKRMREGLKKLGINVDTPEDRAVQIYGEGMMPIDQLMREFPDTWGKIKNADILFRNTFDTILPVWNEFRVKYGYKPVEPFTKRPYYRHHTDRNPWWGIVGALPQFQSYELPTEIAGLTENFNPGKKWTSAELHRTGNRTHYSAVKSLDNYLENVVNQMFHIDSIQRGRAIEKYIRAVAKISRTPKSASALPTKENLEKQIELSKIQEPIKLPNFVTNLHEHTNLIAGKNSVIDRALESGLLGRNVINFMNEFRRIYGINVIGANLSSALTHMLPLSFNIATVDKISAVKGLVNTLASPFAADFTQIDGMTSSFLARRYPERSILPTKYEKITGLLGAPFEMVDKFISRMAVASRYYEGISAGLSGEEALSRADNYAGRVVGSRSIGDLPNVMRSKTLGFFTQFQIEVNDNMQVLWHDIPRWSKEDLKKGQKIYDLVEKKDKAGNSYYAPRNKNYAKIASMLASFLIFSHLVNYFLKKIKGVGKGLDPLQLGLDLAGLNDDGIPFLPQRNPGDENAAKRVLTAGKDLLAELPLTNFFTGQIPAASAIPNPADILSGKSTVGGEFVKMLKNLASPVGGGSQAIKTYGGISDYLRGYRTSASGKTQYPLDKTPGNLIKSALFGSTNFAKETQAVISRNAVMPAYRQIKELVLAGKKTEAAKIYNALSAEDKKEFMKIKTSEKRQETLSLELKMKTTVEKVRELVLAGKKDEAAKIYNALSAAEKHAFMLEKKKLYPK